MHIRRKRQPTTFEDSFEGAVDIVFLLIIFFLVASTFRVVVQEKLSLPERTKDASAQVTDKEPPPLVTVTIFKDSQIKVDRDLIELKEPNSLETYQKILDILKGYNEKINRKEFEETKGVTVELPVTIKSDKMAPSGVVLHVIMACLDSGITPQVIFEESQILKESNE